MHGFGKETELPRGGELPVEAIDTPSRSPIPVTETSEVEEVVVETDQS